MNKLREKFLEIQDSQARYGGNLMFENEAEQCEQITDDFADKFLIWVATAEDVPIINGISIEEHAKNLRQIFKEKYYE